MIKFPPPDDGIKIKIRRLQNIGLVMKLFAVPAIILFLVSAGFAVYYQFFNKPYYLDRPCPNQWKGGLFKIEVQDGATHGFGTGFSLGPQIVITCSHVVFGKSDLTVELITERDERLSGIVYFAGNFRANPLEDFALITIDPEQRRTEYLFPAYERDLKAIEDRHPISIMGFQLDAFLVSVEGAITARNRPDGLFQFDPSVNPGVSGAPIISNQYCEVIGMVTATGDQVLPNGPTTQGRNLGLPIDNILRRIDPEDLIPPK